MPAYNEAEILDARCRRSSPACATAASRSRCSSSRTARPTAPLAIAHDARRRSIPRCTSITAATTPTTARAARRAARAARRRGRQLRRRLLRPRLPRRRGRAGAPRPTARDRRRLEARARARDDRGRAAPARRRGASARCCASLFGSRVSDTHGMKAMRRAARRAVRAPCRFGAGPLRHRALILRSSGPASASPRSR